MKIINFILFITALNILGVLGCTFYLQKEASYLMEVYEDIFELIGIDKYIFIAFPIFSPTRTLRNKLQEHSINNEEINKYLKIVNVYKFDFVISPILLVIFGFLAEKLK